MTVAKILICTFTVVSMHVLSVAQDEPPPGEDNVKDMKTLVSQMNSFQQQFAGFMDRLDGQKTDDIHVLKEKVAELHTALQSSIKRTKGSKKKFNALAKVCTGAMDRIKTLEEYRNETGEKLEGYKTEAGQLNEKLEEYKTQLNEKLEEYKTQLNEKLEEYKTQLNEKLEEYTTETSQLKEKLEEYKTKTSLLNETVEVCKHETSQLKEKLEEYKNETSELNEKLEEYKTKSASLKCEKSEDYRNGTTEISGKLVECQTKYTSIARDMLILNHAMKREKILRIGLYAEVKDELVIFGQKFDNVTSRVTRDLSFYRKEHAKASDELKRNLTTELEILERNITKCCTDKFRWKTWPIPVVNSTHSHEKENDSYVYQPASSSLQIRLVGGRSPLEGRLEVYHDGEWGTVCHNDFDTNDARVACRMLGTSGGMPFNLGSLRVKAGTGTIWMSELGCSGEETSLLHCTFNGWGDIGYPCSHRSDIGVSCLDNEFQVRLAGGKSSLEGRLEVYAFNRWGTVCADRQFDGYEANVVCRMLGTTGGIPLSVNSRGLANRLDEGTGTIWMSGLQCSGEESSLHQCRFKGWGVSNCYHRDDAVVACRDFPVRLVGGSSLLDGRLEVFVNEWGTVCGFNFDVYDAKVACRMLGATGGRVLIGSSVVKGTGPIWMMDLRCKGTETSLLQCPFDGLGKVHCSHGSDVGVSCTPLD